MPTNKRLFRLLTTALAFFPICTAMAGGYELHNVAEAISGIYTSGAGDVILGPNAQISVNGDWYITAANIYIHPQAQITGTGTIHLMSPSTYGDAAAPTNLDGGGAAIGCRLSVENGNTITLNYIDPALYYPTSGVTDTHAAGSDDLVMSNSLNFNNTGAHIILGNYNIRFSSDAAAMFTYEDLNTAGFSQDPVPGAVYNAYVVTNGSGVITKQGLGNLVAFTYPVGQSAPSAAPYDYTPATVTNTDGIAHDISVKVQRYSNSEATEGSPQKGIDRTWNIYADTAATAAIALTHNAADNSAGYGTDGTAFTDTVAFVSQQISNGTWSWDSTWTNGGAPVSIHSSNNFTLATSGSAPTAFFTKSSSVNSVSDVVTASPVVFLQGAMNGTTMKTTLNTNNLIPKIQPYGTLFSYSGKEKVTAIPAGVTDWVLVELRDSVNPATVVARRAAFVKNDGTVVDIDGTSPVSFSAIPTGSYYMSVRHRNHLGIRTPSLLSFSLNGTTVLYDFSTAQAQAYQNSLVTTNAAMKNMGNGIFAMWGGNGANTGAGGATIRATGAATINDYAAILSKLNGSASATGQYDATDYNMDGTVRATGTPVINDYTFLLNVLGSNTSLTQHL